MVSVIMLNWNTPEMTVECVKSVRASNYPNFVVNVIDNGSTLANYEKLRHELGDLANLVRLEKNVGYVGGINAALETASKQRPDYFLIMNNDTTIDENAISSLVDAASRHNNQCVVTGKVYHFDDPERLQTVGNRFDDKTFKSHKIGANEIDEGQHEQQTERKMIDDIFMLLPAEIYARVGGYNPYFFLNAEQADLILRIRKAGYKVIYTPGAKLYHKGSFSSGGLGNPYMMYWDGKSNVVLRYLHLPRRSFYSSVAKILWSSTYAVIKSIVGLIIVRHSEKQFLSRYARLRGAVDGIWWSFNPKPESGKNPFKPR